MISGILVHLMVLNCYNDVSRSCDTKWPPYVAKHFNQVSRIVPKHLWCSFSNSRFKSQGPKYSQEGLLKNVFYPEIYRNF